MNGKTLLLIAVFFACRLSAEAGTLDDKTTAYFVDRYGPARSTKEASADSFFHPKQGAVSIKGQFSVREFRKGDLLVKTVFSLPSLRLAAVRLQLQGTWTDQQIEAALAAYGGQWTPVRTGNSTIKTWVAPDGTMAINMLTWVDIQSKTVVDLVAAAVAAADAKRKAVPKF